MVRMDERVALGIATDSGSGRRLWPPRGRDPWHCCSAAPTCAEPRRLAMRAPVWAPSWHQNRAYQLHGRIAIRPYRLLPTGQ